MREGPRPDSVSRRTDRLVASVIQHHRAISAHHSQLLAAVVELDRRKAWRVDGATSMVAWLVQQCGVAAATAREWVTAAAKLQELPKISDALAQGKLSFDQVKPLVEVAKPATDAQLAEQATHWSAKQVRELAIAARQQSDGQATGFYARRFLRFDDRRRMLTGILPEEQYAVVKGSLVARASRRLKERAPFDQRMADALVALCKRDVAGAKKAAEGGEVPRAGGMRRNRPTVVVHADLSFLAGGGGGAELDVLGPLSREVARRLACDAKVLVSADGSNGQSLNLGRTRRDPSDAQRIEIRRRDKGCRFPGCAHTEFTDVHHVLHWTSGGATDLRNLVELCDRHHRFVHEMGWKLSGDANVELTFRSPTGRLTTSTPSPAFRGAARDGPPG
ncbi:MAG TPA: DUF222 domain-containing protein [Acidimicrobiales bacterium]|jgi:hypothetical protein|nr:DUF222 domain-containing protein [Acidimicrobiales bacterium]